MSDRLFDKPPYFDWRIDRWKVGLIVLLFLALLLTTLIDPHWDRSTDWTAVGPLEPVATAASVANTNAQLLAEETASLTAVAPTVPASLPLPLTLASIGPNAVAPAEAIVVLSGTGQPGNRIEVRSQHIPATASGEAGVGGGSAETLLGVAVADTRGLWTLPLEDKLEAGQHVFSLHELGSQGGIVSVASPVVITVLAAGEEGPVSLSTPAIRFPAAAARLRGGRVTFVGSGLPGMRVRLFLDNRQIAEGVVNTREEWRITPDEEIAPGIYIARVAALDPQGEVIAESPPVAFAVLDAVEGMSPQPSSTVPSIPLALTGASRWGRSRNTLLLTGRATPHSTVSAWRDEAALRYVNARVDGGWQIWLAGAVETVAATGLTVRTNLGESVSQESSALGGAAAASYPPVLLSPKEGEVLANGQPVLLGLAQPDSEITLAVNSTIVARLVADPRGQWAYQPAEPFPSGEVAIAAYAETALVYPAAESTPVFVTVPPRS